MSENTVIKPRPGARQASPRRERPSAGEDSTEFAPVAASRPRERFRLPATNLGPVCDQASRLLSLADRLAESESVADIASLKRQCMDLIREYRQALGAANLLPDTVETASYCVCALLDEIVLNSEWGQAGRWAASSLLSEFHSQTWAGTHFFELVDKAVRSSGIQLLTLQYLCLSLGFKGKFRVEEHGQEQLDTLRDSLYQQICAERGRYATPFDRSWEPRVVTGNALGHSIPVWVVGSVCGVVLLLVYLGLTHRLGNTSEPLRAQIAGLGVPETLSADLVTGEPADARYLRQILQTEMDRGFLEVTMDGNRVKLLIGNEALFSSGQAAVREDMAPVLSKIARALESTSGSIMVAGHSDNRPIATDRYPSNWHLSLARATAVSDMMSATVDFNGRLWPEGRGATEPRFGTDAPQDRNRRVEITLIP
ncbi:type IVB secretion system protein IcmH/DotU [Marinobacter sp.]|uniref:type IVB secretion system protein IcmH/DotU n=1 Tax=Marinobacter sp. TaxID=50741 RepID=UPI003850F7B0